VYIATPHAAAVAALVWSNRADCSALQIRTAIEESATDLGESGYDVAYGYGLVQAKDAIAYIDANFACGSTVTPTCDDGLRNGDEIGIDCGGSCPNTCPPVRTTATPSVQPSASSAPSDAPSLSSAPSTTPPVGGYPIGASCGGTNVGDDSLCANNNCKCWSNGPRAGDCLCW
jgi:hypothetical protein